MGGEDQFVQTQKKGQAEKQIGNEKIYLLDCSRDVDFCSETLT